MKTIDRLMTSSDVAKEFGVTNKTVIRWTESGKITCFKTLGGHRRYSREKVMELLKACAGEKS